MRHPAQKLYYCAQSKLIYAGIAGSIQIFDTASGILVKQWDAPQLPTVTTKKQKQQQRTAETHSVSTAEKGDIDNDTQLETVNVDSIGDEEGVAVKKRKVDDITSLFPSKAIVVEGKSVPGPTQKRKKISFREAPGMGGWSANKGSNLITHIVGTTSGRHLVVVTNEDKTVRVFRVSELVKGRDIWATAGCTGEIVDGDLRLLSERQMPKRLSALKLLEKTPNPTEEEEICAGGVVIICGDKFGDVYSLPLIYNPEEKRTSTPAPGTSVPKLAPEGSSATPEPERKTPRDTGIITTARNKRAAKTSSETTGRNSIANLEAKELQFKHKLLLGHVSLLLDVIPVSLEVELPDGAKRLRTWILSADKDEHIRVTRYPQSYVIDGFCFGHTSYVAKLLTPSWNKSILISGGGDDYLLRWDWRSGNIDQKLDLKEHVLNALDIVRQNENQLTESNIKESAMEIDSGELDELIVSVTGLWEFRDKVQERNQVFVSVEGLPAIFVFTERVTGTFEYTSTVGFSGNVLDVTILEGKALVSIDSQSTPYQLLGSGTSGEESKVLIECIEPDQDGHFTLITNSDGTTANINSNASWEITNEQKEKLDEFLYAAKHLRKFEGDSAEKGGD